MFIENQANPLYINGQWLPGKAPSRDVVNPATGEICCSLTEASQAQLEQAVSAANRAFAVWSQLPATERADYINKVTEALTQRIPELTQAITQELGCPLWFSEEVQVKDSIDAFSKYAEQCHLVEEESEHEGALIVKEAIGVCAFITPWNYPLYQLVVKVAPALAAGCTMVLKPSEQTPLHALLFAEAVAEAGLPQGVFNLVLGDGPNVGAPLCEHSGVDLISFTGSTRAGVAISKAAASSVKKVCLELGGKSPLLICEDADLTKAVKFGVDDVMLNSGQTCTALTRMLVPQSRYEEAKAIAKTYTESLIVAPPTQENSFLGPLSSEIQLEKALKYVALGLEEGATLLTGGNRIDALGEGYYMAPTIFSEVTNLMTIAREEIFGPVLCMIPYSSLEEAVEIANDTPYGLSARVFSADSQQALQLARQIRAGQVFINEAVFNNFIPFGGFKQSGIGRESGPLGVEEFFEVKAIPLGE